MHDDTHIQTVDELYFQSDILIVGAGPAGLLLALSCLNEGFSVSIVEKDTSHVWHQNFCFWKEELSDVIVPEEFQKLFNQSIEMEWDRALVRINRQTQVEIESTFVKFNTPRLQQQLTKTVQSLGAKIFEDTIQSIEHHPTHSVIKGDRKYQSKVVVLASGSTSNLLSYTSNPKPAFQIAYGQLLKVNDASAFDLNAVGFMNFDAPLKNKRQYHYPPSFLYTLPMSSTEIFVEETILATRDTVDWSLLTGRLAMRKQSMGLQDAEVLDEEHCVIQMGGSLPKFGRTLAFGAAAGFTHPVTGFQMTRSICTAPRLAKTLRQFWNDDVDTLCTESWGAIWTESEERNRRLYLLGLDMITRFNLRETQSFFDAFFKVSAENRADFLSGWGPTKSVESTMWQTFQHANWGTRTRIVQHSIQHPSSLFSALLGTSFLEPS